MKNTKCFFAFLALSALDALNKNQRLARGFADKGFQYEGLKIFRVVITQILSLATFLNLLNL